MTSIRHHRPRAAGLRSRLVAGVAIVGLLAGCQPVEKPDAPTPLPPLAPGTPVAVPQVDGPIGSLKGAPRAQVSYGRSGAGVQAPGAQYSSGAGGDVSLDFADTDIRAVAQQILGDILHANYTIDPGVHGTVTLHTAQPLTHEQLLSTLQVLLSEVGASLSQDGGLYRISAAAGATPGAVQGPGGLGSGPNAGAVVVPLHSTSAEALARVLAPYAGAGAHIAADPAANAIIINAPPAEREAIVEMVHSFDVDTLADKSFALLPVDSGDAKDFSTALSQALSSDQGKSLANVIRVIPMTRIDAVLVVVPTDAMMGDVRRIYGLVLHQRRETVRSWHVYYLQNGRSNDVAYVLQQAFTPDHVTAQPTQQNQLQQLGQTQNALGAGGSSGGIGGSGSSGGIGGGLGSSSGSGTSGSTTGTNGGTGQSTQASSGASSNPLLGGLEQGGTGEGGSANKDEMRIVPADQDNALLIYGTPQELDTVENTLRKIDIVPLQVRIDATIAEVDLNHNLEYGTQFFFKSAGATSTNSDNIAGLTSTTGNTTSGTSTTAGGVLSQVFTASASSLSGGGFGGFLLAGGNAQQAAIDALQEVSKVRMLSAPELTVLDNQPARVQVGEDVPVLSSQQQSTLVANSSLVNSVSYVPTGVMLQITPRVNNDGQITLDIAEEVSSSLGITTTSGTAGPNSPTFSDRNVQTRVVVQDGQTIGIAGLIQDSDQRQNQGVPYVRNIPVIGALFGQQNNSRMRTELLVMITPHVERDAHDARALTEDMEAQMPYAASVPEALQKLPQEGLSDPNGRVLRSLGLQN